ncbi:hypothetical protein QZH41_000532 [Actinostola sp. cb2023]|nr:hypothetical protein QZH41_000532 [Actinostola sp. cb2023]
MGRVEEDPLVANARTKLYELFPKVKDHTEDFFLRNTSGKGIEIKLPSKKGIGKWRDWQPLFKRDGAVQTKVKQSWGWEVITGPEKILEANDAQIAQNRKDNVKDEAIVAGSDASEADKEAAQARIAERTQQDEAFTAESEATEERMTLREKVKYIFKKYGFTFVGVAVAAGAVIAAVVSALSARLAAVAGAMGNELKAIGKKLAELLPGSIGAIASFIFRTAGEVVEFLTKNAWLVIIGIVVFLVERVSSKRKSR